MEDEKLKAITDDIISTKPLFYRAFGRPFSPSPTITPGAYYVLMLLAGEGEMSMSEIGDKLNVSKPNVTTLIDKLTGSKLTGRLPDKQDRRIIKIRLTKKGADFVEKNKQIFREQISEKLLTLTDKELNTFVTSMHNLKGILHKIATTKNQ